MKKPKTEFDKLKDEWYLKLKESGFDDLENNADSLNRAFSRSVNYTDPFLREVHEEYYRLAYHMLNDYKFASELDKVIWEYHAEGLSIRDIVKVLNKTPVKTNRTRVWKVIQELEATMKHLYLSA